MIREKLRNFQGQGKVMEFLKKSVNFLKSQGNSLILSKSVKSERICCLAHEIQPKAERV